MVTNEHIQHNKTEENDRKEAARLAKKTNNAAILEGRTSGYKVVSMDMVVDVPTEVAGSLGK